MENGRSFRYDYFMDKRKDLHMKQAASYISYFEEAKDRIHDAEIENGINELLRKLRDLRDLQYWFDSGEKELDRFYERYLPYLNTIVENYIKLEGSWNFDELPRIRGKLAEALRQFADMITTIMKILPEDEISEASAEAKAKKAKQELDEAFNRMHLTEDE